MPKRALIPTGAQAASTIGNVPALYWILRFSGKSLSNPTPERWKVKKEGGVFDQFTGATITPRAVIKATRKFLEYVQMHHEALFAPLPDHPKP